MKLAMWPWASDPNLLNSDSSSKFWDKSTNVHKTIYQVKVQTKKKKAQAHEKYISFSVNVSWKPLETEMITHIIQNLIHKEKRTSPGWEIQ